MIKNFLLITWRSMMKNKLFIFINVMGLAISIGCCIVAYFNWEYNATFDDHHVNKEKIYRVSSMRTFNDVTKLYGYAPLAMGEAIRQNVQDAEKVSRFNWSGSNLKIDDNIFPAQMGYVDPDFFQMFSFEFISGNPAELKDKSKLFISDELANTLFGTTDVLGKQVTQVIGSELKEVVIGGVYKKLPENNSFSAKAFMNFENLFDEDKKLSRESWKDRSSLFVMVSDPMRLEAVSKQIQPFKENNNLVREDFQISEFRLDPFHGMARRDTSDDTPSWTRSSNPTAAVIAPMMMAILILLISCFNMTNTFIAISSRRLKEIGIRKVMGSARQQLIGQFLGETLFICVIALFVGLFLGEFLIGAWNSLWDGMKLESHYFDSLGFVFFLIATLLFTALLSGFYPAFYISHFEPVSILKGKLKFGGTNYFTRFLLWLQYSVSLVAIISAFAFYQNSIFQRDFNIGFQQDGVIIAYVNNQSEFETYRNQLIQNKDISLVAGSKHSVASSIYNDPIKHNSQQVEVDIIDVGDRYLEAMDMKLIEGRDFQKDSETDKKESVIITEQLARSFKWDKPIGKEIIWMDTVKLYVVGVVKDVYTRGLWRPMEPMMMRYTGPENYTHVIVNAPIEKMKAVNDFMEKEWKSVFPNRLYNGRYLNDSLVEATTVNNNIVKMFVFLGAMALLLSATGLFTLVSLNIIRKMKEIGVRKVLGASVGNITRIVNTEFMIILTLASAFGSVMAWFAVDALMGSIWEYYQPATAVSFTFSVLLMFLISAIAVGFKVLKAARMNPVNTLRSE